jgi:hypothetical protein
MKMFHRIAHLALVVLGVGSVGFAPELPAQGLNATRVTSVNGRQVFELRMGVVPRTGVLRTLVLTAGPVAGSTSLLVNTSLVGAVMNANVPMTFSVVVNSGSLYSLGGGCARAGELNFPYIDGTRFRIVRYTGTTQTIVSPPAIAAQYEGVNCISSWDGQAVYYSLVNRTTQRVEVWRELAGGVFARVYQNAFAIRLPFNGGLRPQISRMFRVPTARTEALGKGTPQTAYEPNHLLVSTQDSNGNSAVKVVDVRDGSEAGDCPIGTRTAGSPPFEGFLSPDFVVADFNGDGVADAVSIRPTVGGLCEVGTRRINLGSTAGGNGYNWTGFGITGDTSEKHYRFINGRSFKTALPAIVNDKNSNPFLNRGGPFHAAYLEPGENDFGTLALGTAANNTQIEFFAFAPALPPNAVRIFGGSFEDGFNADSIVIEVSPSPP